MSSAVTLDVLERRSVLSAFGPRGVLAVLIAETSLVIRVLILVVPEFARRRRQEHNA